MIAVNQIRQTTKFSILHFWADLRVAIAAINDTESTMHLMETNSERFLVNSFYVVEPHVR